MPARAFSRRLTASYFTPFVVMALLATVVLWRFEDQARISQWVQHSDKVLLRAKDAEIDLIRMQMGFHMYVVTRDQSYMDEFQQAHRSLGNELDEIAALVTDNPDQERHLLDISDLKGNYARGIDELVTDKQIAPDSLKKLEVQGHRVFDAVEAFILFEKQVRARRIADQARLDQLIFVLVPVSSVIVAIFLSYWGWRQIRFAGEEFSRALLKAEAASRAKDNFLGTVSHELRNPLNSIMLWSSTLLSEPAPNERVRRGLTAIERAARAQTQLIEDLLDISRIESGRMRLDIQRVDLAEVVQSGVESLRAAAEAKSVTLQTMIDPRIDLIAGDPARLQQVTWNLVSNAVKFTPKGGKVQVRVERINSHVEIIVADNGKGIAPAQLPLVFDRFWQADHEGQTARGVGLGLSIVKEIVALHGGTIQAQSEGLGKGATFTVRLPLPVTKAVLTELRRHPTVAPLSSTAGAPRLDGASVLVVDDDQDACEALKSLLGALGADVTSVTSAEAAFTTLDRLHPDVVVSDIGMPVHDGYFLARELRRREADSGVRMPLVALTAYGRVEDKVKILAAGFDTHLVKPVDPAELAAVLSTLITSRAA